MTKIFKFIVIVSFLVFAGIGVASPIESKSSQFGLNMAITDFTKEDGFKMSEKALDKLKVKFAKIEGEKSWALPEEALVRIKQSTGVYRRLDGWITLVLVKVSERKSGVMKITSADLENGDEVAITGVSYLRMADADLNSDTVDSCSH